MQGHANNLQQGWDVKPDNLGPSLQGLSPPPALFSKNADYLQAGFHAQYISGVQRRVGKFPFVSVWEGFDSCKVELGPI